MVMKETESEESHIDESIFVALIKKAVETNDYSDDVLGKYVTTIVDIVIKRERLNGYTDDWKCEMLSDASFDMFKAMPKANLDESRIFNYMYTIARNRIFKTIDKLNGQKDSNVSFGDNHDGSDESFFVKNKRNQLRGFYEKTKLKIIERSFRKVPFVGDYVGRACRKFSDGLKDSTLSELIEISRKERGVAV